jgi:predicted lysophospholipase L1 biosynthesis ABC-type transport system permease subunit
MVVSRSRTERKTPHLSRRALAALALTVAFGLVGTFTALSHKPGPVLRNL